MFHMKQAYCLYDELLARDLRILCDGVKQVYCFYEELLLIYLYILVIKSGI